MSKNPLVNALLAELYIVILVLMLNYGQKSVGLVDNLIMPIAMLSLFVLSAAVMGYLFLSQPIQLYLEGEKKKALGFFIKIIMIFSSITAVILILLFSGILL